MRLGRSQLLVARGLARHLVSLVSLALVLLVGRSTRAQSDYPQPEEWDSWIEPVQAVVPAPFAGLANEQRVRIQPRGSARWQAESDVGESGERIITIDSGVNILIDNVGNFNTIDISTDRIVIWTTDDALSSLQDSTPTDLPLEFYMEGNIVFREGGRTIYADRMYYDVRTRAGVILNSEMLTPMAGYNGLVRLKAEVLRQIDEYRFQGTNAGLTTSRMGYPRYWMQSSRFDFTSTPRPVTNPATGATILDPRSGQPQAGYERFASSRGNSLFLGPVPVFYWPTINTDLNQPTYYLKSFAVNSDSVFGTQVLTEWDLYQLLGINNPIRNSEWTASADYLSKRGFGFGTEFNYQIDQFLNRPGRAVGFIDAWGINDGGLDNLGQDRRTLALEEEFRGRVLGRHRHHLPGGFQFNTEAGLISDRNFLEQYYEEEWDLEKDLTTGVELKKRIENRSWSITADARVNDFFTQSEWLPRFDHFWLGQSILGDWFTWSEHTNVGYGHLRVAEPPTDPAELAKFNLLAWEADREGIRAASRHEISLPLDAGLFKVVPYALGEAAYWHEDLAGNEANRLFGQTGIRTSLPMWNVDPTVRSELFNLNGLAHKVVYEAEFLWADASQNLQDLPLYDNLDDDSIEFFRRRFFFDTFGGVGTDTPLKFDERLYAFRSNQQGWVTSPSTELADDLMAFRLAAEQRWQTKRGLAGRERIVDWVSLNLHGFVYPRADRDNFGQEVGLLGYDLQWHPGDRFTVLSDGQVDLFADGLRTFSLSGIVTRPSRGLYSTGFRSIEGPISSNILFGSTSYRISPKWIINYGSSYDFGKAGNLGQSGQIVRVGESFLVGLGVRYDSSRDNFSVRFAIEPRFLAGKLSRVGGVPIPAVGSMGFE